MVCDNVCIHSCSLFLLIPVRCYTWEKVEDKCGRTQYRGCGYGVDWMGHFRLVVLHSIQRMDLGVSVGDRSSSLGGSSPVTFCMNVCAETEIK